MTPPYRAEARAELALEPAATEALAAPDAAARIPATAGELVQGWLDGEDFLVNSPIDLYAEAHARWSERPGVHITHGGTFTKVRDAVADLLAASLPHGGRGLALTIRSRIARGKGLASSTAEISAALAAAARLLERPLGGAEAARLNVRHDPTDGTFFPGISRLNQLTGRLHRALGEPPPLRFVLVDTGGAIDSRGFERAHARAVARANEQRLRQALESVRLGLRFGRASLIAEGATASAEINQAVLPKPAFDELRRGTAEFGGLGVNCAHTGTVLGVMYDPTCTDAAALHDRIRALVAFPLLGDHALVGGGAR